MNLAEKIKADINFDKIVEQLRTGLANNDRVLISSELALNNIDRIKASGFEVNSDGQWREGGVYVSFKKKNQWR